MTLLTKWDDAHFSVWSVMSSLWFNISINNNINNKLFWKDNCYAMWFCIDITSSFWETTPPLLGQVNVTWWFFSSHGEAVSWILTSVHQYMIYIYISIRLIVCFCSIENFWNTFVVEWQAFHAKLVVFSFFIKTLNIPLSYFFPLCSKKSKNCPPACHKC